MSTLIFSANRRLLSVRGPCIAEDRVHLVDAVEAFARSGQRLIVDFSRTAMVPRSVADSLIVCCRRLEGADKHVTVVTQPGSPVERMFQMAGSQD
jgi:hypothetical protein